LLVNALLRETGRPVTAEQAEQLQRYHAEAYARRVSQVWPLPRAIDLLASLTRVGVPWVIATSRKNVRETLAVLGTGSDVPVVARDEVQHAGPRLIRGRERAP